MSNIVDRDVETATPHFYYRPVKDKRASEEQGSPVYRNVPYVKIFQPGEKYMIPDVQVTEVHQRRWPQYWDAFENAKSEVELDGTPLEEWPGCEAAEVEHLKSQKVFTVEQFAALPGHAVQKMGPHFQKLQQRAFNYCENATGNALVLKMEALEQKLAQMMQTDEDKDAQIEALKMELAEAGKKRTTRRKPPKVNGQYDEVEDDAA